MGKNLIIKGADFSINAVAHEVVEPTDFVQVDGVGTAGYQDYNIGDIFYRCQHGKGNELANIGTGLYRVISGAEHTERPSLSIGTTIKINDMYFKMALADDSGIEPYYGVKSLAITKSHTGHAYVDSSTAPTDVTSGVEGAVVNLTGGKKYVIFAFGGNTYSTAIVKNGSTYTEIGSIGMGGVHFIEYTAVSGDVLYLTSSRGTALGRLSFVAEVLD